MAGSDKNNSSDKSKKIAKECTFLIGKAAEALSRKNIKKAEEIYLKAIKIGCLHEIVFSNLGVIYERTNRKKEALESYKKAISINPRFSDSHLNLGNLYREIGKTDQAISATLKSLELKPDNPKAHMNLGIMYKDIGNSEKAIAAILKSLELKPNNPKAYINLGIIHKDLGKYDLALTSTLKALELQPNNAIAHMNLGVIHKNLGQLNQALASINKSIELQPKNATAHLILGTIYKKLGRIDKALVSTLQSLEIKPKSLIALNSLGKLYFGMGDFKNSEKAFDCAMELNSHNQDISLSGKAACCYARKDYRQCLILLKSRKCTNDPKTNSYPEEAALKATIDSQQRLDLLIKSPAEKEEKYYKKCEASMIKITHRIPEDNLIDELYSLEKQKLSQTNDARKGEGFCTNFKLFTHTSPLIRNLEADLINIISLSLGKEACSLKHDSFFNIFKMGAKTTPHDHIQDHDLRFELWRHKYSLVYYLDPGDQNCAKPGILTMHDPDIQLLPKKGMIVIIPATRKHSSIYDGSQDRLMIGVNFYAFPPENSAY